MNAQEIQDKLANDQGMAAALTSDTHRGDEDKIRELYLSAFAREPNEKEIALAGEYIAKETRNKNDKETLTSKRHAYEDIIWALLNTKEFLFNH